MRALLRGLMLLAGLAALASCTTPIRLPADFVELRDAGEGLRAVTSDDARVWVRELWDPTEGSVDFWAATLKNDLIEQRGYQFVGEGELADAAGEAGRWLEFATDVRGVRVGYLVALWVRTRWLQRGCWLQTVEYTAAQDVYAARVDAVRAALATVRW